MFGFAKLIVVFAIRSAGVALTHKALEQRLHDELGLVSAWHATHPDELEPATLYHHSKEHKAFHIDYCFIPHEWARHLREVSIRSFADYQGRSDHRPLTIEIELP